MNRPSTPQPGTPATRALRAAAALALSGACVLGGTLVPASANDADVIKRGSCSGSADWKLKASPENGRIEVEGEVDSNVVGQTWRWRILHDGEVSFSGRATTVAPSGSFERRRLLVDTAGCRPGGLAGPQRQQRRDLPREPDVLSATPQPGTDPGTPGNPEPSPAPTDTPAAAVGAPPSASPRTAARSRDTAPVATRRRTPAPPWRQPALQLAAAGVLIALVVGAVVTVLAGRIATRESITDARTVTEVLGRSVAQPSLNAALLSGSSAALDRFDREVRSRLLVGRVLRVKIWTGDGTVVYSDQTALIGRHFDLDPEEREVLADGGSDAEVSDLDQPENALEGDSTRLLEVYTRIEARNGTPLLFEAYFAYDDVERRAADVRASFLPVALLGLAAVLLLATPLVGVLGRRLAAAGAERERLLRAAVDASEAERRRIARDLHDSVVQDLAGTSFGLSALARELPEAHRQQAADLAAAVRGGLTSLRSLLVEIYPPDLATGGLRAALADLEAAGEVAGVAVDLDVGDVDDLGRRPQQLVWRAAQEAVRNALRHAEASHLRVVVRRETGGAHRSHGAHGAGVVLEVEDDGVGFTPAQGAPAGHLGLRGLGDLVQEAGGRLDVDSAPGRGTTVRLWVPDDPDDPDATDRPQSVGLTRQEHP